MTALEKQVKVKEVLSSICWNGYEEGCKKCKFFNAEDNTGDEVFCSIRDSEKRIPYENGWDMASAMISD